MQRAMAVDGDEIRKLCKELLAGKDDDQQIQKLVELRAALAPAHRTPARPRG